jgi:hypothetical protein
MKRLFLPLFAVALWGCADATIQQPELRAPAGISRLDECDSGGGTSPTQFTNIECDPGANASTWPFFGPAGNAPYQAAGDPYPNDGGIYLGSAVSPSACFADQNSSVNSQDADHDWISDSCELELARAFAPLWKMSRQDQCLGGEPYWAVKYFPPNLVRIAYMPAYYKDCGSFGHSGDSEFVMVEVSYAPSIQHWMYNQMYLSAHHGTITDHSAWVGMTETEFSWKFRAHPTVWVAIGKHADYKSFSDCSSFADVLDQCDWSSQDAFRFPIDASHNVGSRFTAFKDCVYSASYPSSAYECFWTEKSFRGWQTVISGDAPQSYRSWLISDKFEYTDALFTDGGPGPSPAP